MHGVPWGPACLSVQVVTLDKHSVVTEASHPHVPLALALQLNPFADVKPWGEGKGGKDRTELKNNFENAGFFTESTKR